MFNQPYPLREIKGNNIIKILLAGLFVAGFLLFFQPFGIFEWVDQYKNLKIAGYGVVTVIVLLIDFYGIRQNWKAFFNERNWKVWKEIVWEVFILTSVTIGNYLYNVLILHTAVFQFKDFLIALITTFSIGLFPTAGFILSNYIIQLRHYSKPVPIQHPPAPVSYTILELVAENEKDRIVLDASQLLFIESADNYCTIYFSKSGKISKELIRSSLTRIEAQLPLSEIVRCHRSYIVNLAKVERVSGNAQGYKLHLNELEEPVPVARKYSKIVSKMLQ